MKTINDALDKKTLAAISRASKKKNWRELRAIIEPMYKKNHGTLPKELYPPFIMALAMDRDFDLGISVVKNASEEFKSNFAFLKAEAELYFLMGDLAASLLRLETIQKKFELKSDWHTDNRYYQILKTLNKEQRSNSIKNSTGPAASHAMHAYEYMANGHKDSAEDSFRAALAVCFKEEELIEKWLQCFRMAFATSSLLKGDSSVEFPQAPVKSTEQKSRVLIASGMGWSGSGAVYDFLSEFESVTRIKGEFPFIEGKFGMRSLFETKNRDAARKRFLDFFFFSLFGFHPPKDRSVGKITRFTKKLTSGKEGASYAELVKNIINTMKESISEQGFGIESLQSVVMQYIEFQMILMNVPKDTIPLFDNIVHIQNAQCFSLINNFSAFCTFRDPRSNYVARVQEDRMFSGEIDSFILDYRTKRRSIDKKLCAVADSNELKNEDGMGIQIVQFENFVMDRNYRRNLAEKAGLDFAQQDEYSRFKPWESEKNVFLFENYENQDEIRYIEKELAEYCIDLDAFQSMRTST